MIKIHNLEKKLSNSFTLSIDDLVIKKGERVALIGPNGSGKSTLLKLISGTLPCDKGVIAVDGELGYSPQNPYCFSATVEKNILLCAKNKDISEYVSLCLLDGYRKKNALRLSGGEKQRLYLSRILSGEFDCLLLDEPLSATDIDVSCTLERSIKDYCEKRNTTLLISTHLPSQAVNIADKIIIMNNGRIEECLTCDKIANPESEFGKKFTKLWRL